MDRLMIELIERYEKDLDKMNRNRHWWLWASSVVFMCVIIVIFGWEWLSGLKSRSVWWVIVSGLLLVTVNWWYWTMRNLRTILVNQAMACHLMKSISKDLELMREDIKFIYDIHLDVQQQNNYNNKNNTGEDHE